MNMRAMILCIVGLILAAGLAQAGPGESVEIREIAMATPDVIAIDVRDPPFKRGALVAMPAPRAESAGEWVRYRQGWALLVGWNRVVGRTPDTPPGVFLDRAAIDQAAGYGPIGGRRVVAVYRKSTPYDSGVYRGPDGGDRTGSSFRHQIYLQLDGPLAPGAHVIRWPGQTLPDAPFVFDDRATRAVSIRATQLGSRPDDVGKVAYLSLWLPGGPVEGAVDFRRYGVDRFTLIDAAGRDVFAGSVRLRMGPGDAEQGHGLPDALGDYASAAARRIPVRGVKDGRVFANGHGFVAGQRVALERMGGERDATVAFATVRHAAADHFDIADVSGPIPGHIDSSAVVVAAHRANRAGTYVFELDYAAARPAPGVYRLRIAGLGVSDPFEIDPGIWLKAARNSFAGLYHHHSGVALDGRFGYARPEAFRPGRQITLKESLLPYAWTQQNMGGFVPFETGGEGVWDAGRLAPETLWGGYMDAGDWDRNVQHLDVTTLLLDLYEMLPAATRNVSLNLPKASETLDPALYAGTEDLPDLLQEAIWGADFFRRMQVADGGVRGGIESAGHPRYGEPSYMERQAVFAFAPDHISSYKYAYVAARLAHVLREAGKANLAAVYQRSAVAAWGDGERGRNDPDAYYRVAIAAAQQAGLFHGSSWSERRRLIEREAARFHVAAAGALFRLTGEAGYADAVRAQWDRASLVIAEDGDGAWEYMRAPGADPSLAARMAEAFRSETASLLAIQNKLAYPSMKHPFAPAGWGQGGPPDASQTRLLMRAHQLTRDPAILKLMETTAAGIYGANQVGLSFTTGIGVRGILHPLHEDHRAMGVKAPDGITIYGWAPQASTAFDWLFGPAWAPMPEWGVGEYAAHRRIEPSRYALPYFEYLIEHPLVIIQQEYTIHQTIAPMAAMTLYLHGM